MKLKRIISLLLTLVMLLSVFPVSVYAEVEEPAAEPAAEEAEETNESATPEEADEPAEEAAEPAQEEENPAEQAEEPAEQAEESTEDENLEAGLGTEVFTPGGKTTKDDAVASLSYSSTPYYYDTLSAAIADACTASKTASGEEYTVTLLNNVTPSEQIRIGIEGESSTTGYSTIKVALNLNNYSIELTTTGTAAKNKRLFIINANATLSISGSGTVSSGTEATRYLVYFNSSSTSHLNISGGNYETANTTGPFQASGSNTGVDVNVTGGTFNVDPSAYVPDGYKATQNSSGLYEVKPIIAKVSDGTNDYTYTDFAEALVAATGLSTATLTMYGNAALSGNVSFNGDFTLDLNGCTLDAGNYNFAVGTGHSLTIIDSVGTGSVTGTNVIDSTGGGTVSLKGGTYAFDPSSYVTEAGYAVEEIEGKYKVIFCVAKVEIAGGETSYETFAEAFAAANVASTTSVITLLQDCSTAATSKQDASGSVITLDLNGHTLTGPSGDRVFIISRTFTVTDGSDGKNGKIDSASTKEGSVFYVNASGKLTIKAGTIKGESGNPAVYANATDNSSATLKISGGTIKGKVLLNEKNTRTGFITGGTFSVEPEDSYLSGIKATLYTGGMYTLYGTFLKAVEDANIATDTSKIKLISDTGTTGVTIDENKEVEIDLCGHAISCTPSATKRPITVAGTLTITDTTDAKTGRIEGYSGLETDSDKAIKKCGSAIWIESTGKLTIKAGTFEKKSGTSAIHAGGNSTDGYATLIISGGVIIGGYSLAHSKNQPFTVSGGWFDMDVSDYADTGYAAIKVEGDTTTPYTVTSAVGGSIEYNANTAEGAKSSKPADQVNLGYLDDYTVLHEITSELPVYPGHTFTGWNTEAGGTGTSYAAGDSIEFTGDNNNYVLYAQWDALSEEAIKVKIGENSFASISEAISFAEADEILKLSSDITEAIEIPEGKKVTVDLNGHKVSCADSRPVTVDGTLTITDSSTGKNGYVEGYSGLSDSGKGSAVLVNKTGSLTIEAGTFEGKSGASAIHAAGNSDDGYAELIISGGTVIGGYSLANSGKQPFKVSGGWFDESVSKYADEGKQGIKVADESMSATPYTVTETNDGSITYNANGGLEASMPENQTGLSYLAGYTVMAKSRTQTPVREGHSFAGWNTAQDGSGDSYESGAEIQLTGEKHAYILYAQWEEITTRNVKIGDKEYATLGEAIYYAEEGATIALSGDINEKVTVPAGKKITIDLNGHNIEGAGIGSAITVKGADTENGLVAAELTIRDTAGNGYVYGTAQKSGGAVDNSGKLTLESGTLKGIAPNYGAGVYNNEGGVFIMTGGSVIALSAEGEEATEAIFSRESSGSVTISGSDCRIDGKLGGKSEKYIITDGKFTADPTDYITDTETLCAYKESGSDYFELKPLKAKLVTSDTVSRGYYYFTDAVSAMKDEENQYIKLYDNITDAYSLPAGHSLRVLEGEYQLTVEAQDEYCEVYPNKDNETGITTYTCAYLRLTAELTVNDVKATSVNIGEKGVITVKDGTNVKAAGDLTFIATEGASLINAESLAKGEIIPTGAATGTVTLNISSGTRSVSFSFNVVSIGNTISIEKVSGPESYKVDVETAKADPKAPVTYTLKVKGSVGFDPTSVKAVSSNTKVATVKALKGTTDQFIVTLSTKESGKCTISFTAYDGKIALTPVCLDICIYDYEPRVENTVTLNTFSEAPTYITAVESYDAHITSVNVVNTDKKGNRTVNDQITAEYKDGFIAIESTDIITKAFKCVLEITTDIAEEDGYRTYDLPLNVKIKNVYPKITATQIGIYKPYKDTTVSFNVTANVDNELNIGNEDLVATGFEKPTYNDGVLDIEVQSGASKLASSGTALFKAEGYRGYISTKLSIKSAKKASLSLQYTAATIVMGGTENIELPFSVYDKNIKSVGSFNVTAAEAVEGVTVEDNKITVAPTSPLLATAGKKTVKLTVKEGTQTVALSYSFTVIAAKDPVVKLKASTLTLNAKYPTLTASTTYTVDQQNIDLRITTDPVDDTYNGLLKFTQDNGVLTVSIENEVDAKTIKSGTAIKYTVYVDYKYKDADDAEYKNTAKNLTLSVKIINTAATVSFKTVGKLDVVTPENFVTLIPTIKNVSNCSLEKVELLTVNADKKDTTTENPYDGLDANLDGNNVIISLKDGATPGKTSFRVKLTLVGEENNYIVSGAVNLTIGQTALKVKADVTAQTVYQSQANTRTVVYTVRVTSPAGAKIESAKIGKIAALFRSNLADTGANVSFTVSQDGQVMKVYVTMDNTCRIVAGKTYTLPLLISPEGADTTGKADAKLNLTLKVVK